MIGFSKFIKCIIMISVSLNEIYSETYKALRSVNIEWSLAKDLQTKQNGWHNTVKIFLDQF